MQPFPTHAALLRPSPPRLIHHSRDTRLSDLRGGVRGFSLSLNGLELAPTALARADGRTGGRADGRTAAERGGGGRHSVFAQILLQILSQNTEVIEAQRVFLELSARVLDAAQRARFEQRPEYEPMRFAGHESGDFISVPRTQ